MSVFFVYGEVSRNPQFRPRWILAKEKVEDRSWQSTVTPRSLQEVASAEDRTQLAINASKNLDFLIYSADVLTTLAAPQTAILLDREYVPISLNELRDFREDYKKAHGFKF